MANRRFHKKRGKFRVNQIVYLGGGIFVVLIGFFFILKSYVASQDYLVRGHLSLAKVHMSSPGDQFDKAWVTYGNRRVILSYYQGRMTPQETLPMGAVVSITAKLKRPLWLGWLVGKYSYLSLNETTPKSHLTSPKTIVTSGGGIFVNFSASVQRVSVGIPGEGVRHIFVKNFSRKIKVIPSLSVGEGGRVFISQAARNWETLSRPAPLVYFDTQNNLPLMFFQPNLNNGVIGPSESISLVFSSPIDTLFGESRPSINPVIKGALIPKGHWSQPTSHSLVFRPNGFQFWPGEQFRLSLPHSVTLAQPLGSRATSSGAFHSIVFSGISGSTLRLQQLLATLNYLPLLWTPTASSTTALTMSGEIAAVRVAPSGKFRWKWGVLESSLSSYWRPGTMGVVTRGAVMAFEQVNHLNPVGMANPLLWPTLLKATLTLQVDPNPYSWINVSQSLPEKFSLYENGVDVLNSATNTGISQDPSTPGTFPIYLRLRFQIMRGMNPNGTRYADPVNWINYYNASQAVHGFTRSAYGFPQSLGCVELPGSIAAKVWPLVHIGTLVTVGH